jgi:hypothetical protein
LIPGSSEGGPGDSQITCFVRKVNVIKESEAEEKKESLLAIKYQSTHLEIKLHIKDKLYDRVLDTNAYFCYSD